MKFIETPLKGAYLIELEKRGDDRGFFARTFCKNEFVSIGHKSEFVQFNHSITKVAGSIRGMHFQVPPFTEIKLIRCVKGSVYDVIIDIRKDSSTFLNYFAIELSDANMLSLYIPEGFAHGFQSLREDSHLIYHHTAYYTPGSEGALRYNDPLLGIRWPLPVTVISDKDKDHALLNNSFKGI